MAQEYRLTLPYPAGTSTTYDFSRSYKFVQKQVLLLAEKDHRGGDLTGLPSGNGDLEAAINLVRQGYGTIVP